MKKKICVNALAVITISLCLAAQYNASSFDEKAAWTYLKTLSGDLMEGRESGQPGGTRAEDYVAGRFKEWGIVPAGEGGTYFQRVSFDSFRIAGKAELEILLEDGRRSFPYQDDWRILPQSGSASGAFEVVFTGYGISAPQAGYDDYQGVDISGKLALISDKIPANLAEKAGPAASIENRIAAAKTHGAKGIVLFNNSYIVKQYLELHTKPFLFDKRFILLAVEDRIVDFMFKNMKKEGNLSLKTIGGSLQPSSYAVACRVSLSVATEADPKASARNVLGLIPGEDDRLKDEIIVISAHLDHVGINPFGEIMHGANDNASGASVVMEAARCMKEMGIRPKRTILFALWTGEELGLVGSKYYCDHPLFPLDETIVNINLDMVGQGGGKIKGYGVSYFPELWEYLTKKLPKTTAESITTVGYSPGGSDHAAFQDKGIPGLLIQSEGPHFKIHRSRDTIEFVDPESLKGAGTFVLDAVNILGFDSPDFIDPMRQEFSRLKRQTYIDFRCPRPEEVLAGIQDPLIDMKPVLIDGDASLVGDALGLDILKKLLSVSQSAVESGSWSMFSSVNGVLASEMGPGKTTLLAGVQGTKWMEENPKWSAWLKKNDLAFVIESGDSSMFSEKGITKAGIERINKLLGQGIVLILRDLTPAQMAGALTESARPLIIAGKEAPSDELLRLLRIRRSAFGLVYDDDDDPAAFAEKIRILKNKIGTDHVLLFSRCKTESPKGRASLLHLIQELSSRDYKRKELFNIFSGTFMRILCEMRGEDEPLVY